PVLADGDYQLQMQATLPSGKNIKTPPAPMRVLAGSRTVGVIGGTTIPLTYSASDGNGAAYVGIGGTPTLNLQSVARSDVLSIDGVSLASFTSVAGNAPNQAVYHGSAYDCLRLTNGREVYFQNIAFLQFSGGPTDVLELEIHPNDPLFPQQW